MKKIEIEQSPKAISSKRSGLALGGTPLSEYMTRPSSWMRLGYNFPEVSPIV